MKSEFQKVKIPSQTGIILLKYPIFNLNKFLKSRCITELFHAISNHQIHILTMVALAQRMFSVPKRNVVISNQFVKIFLTTE